MAFMYQLSSSLTWGRSFVCIYTCSPQQHYRDHRPKWPRTASWCFAEFGRAPALFITIVQYNLDVSTLLLAMNRNAVY